MVPMECGNSWKFPIKIIQPWFLMGLNNIFPNIPYSTGVFNIRMGLNKEIPRLAQELLSFSHRYHVKGVAPGRPTP